MVRTSQIKRTRTKYTLLIINIDGQRQYQENTIHNRRPVHHAVDESRLCPQKLYICQRFSKWSPRDPGVPWTNPIIQSNSVMY